MDLGIEGKTALVTGATQGIGKSVAKRFAAEGAKVALTYRGQKEKAEAVAAEIEKAGGRAIALYMDLGDDASIRACVAETERQLGGIDILINNATRYQEFGRKGEKFEDVSDDIWRPVLRHTIEGTYLLIQLALPHMRKNKWGRIVNTSSGIAERGFAGRGTYGASKAALHGLTFSLAKEVGPEGIFVNCVIPGLIPGDRTLDELPQAIRDNAARNSGIGRLLTADEIAMPILYLGSAANTAMTAQIVSGPGAGV